MALIIVFSLAACGSSTQDKSTKDSASADEAEKTITVSTPYADLKIPASFEGKVNNKVTSKDPYTVTFSAADTGTELFSVVFNEARGVLLGTIVGEKENTVVYIDYAQLDPKDANYETYAIYQEDANSIVNNLNNDYEFVVNNVIERGDETTFDIKTGVVTLKYPARWKDKVNVDVTDEAASFSSGATKLFDISFVKTDNGYLLGNYKETPVYLVMYELTKGELSEEEFAELNLMQEDYLVVVNNLAKDPNFTAAQNQQSAQ